jgi:uncharacterized protein YdbL (DUF1318 family)
MTWRKGYRVAAIGTLALALAACVPVTVNVTFPQEKLESAARQIEDTSGQSASVPSRPPPAPQPRTPSAGGTRSVDVASTPRLNERSPEVVKVTEARRARRPALREWKSRGCIGETNQGLLTARPGEGCGAEVADLINAENADRQVIYDAFMKENNIPASDSPRVRSAFAKARLERARPNDWIQLENGQWTRKS